MNHSTHRLLSFIGLVALLAGLIGIPAPAAVSADHTPEPASVTLVGSLQSEVGCGGDWDPACAASMLAYDAADEVWQGVFNVPAGGWEYKAALNGGWDENYGLNAQPNGANIPLNQIAGGDVKFYYSHHSHWITDNVNSRIVTAAGSFQSEIGCPGDWQPECLRSWLQDPDGDGLFTFTTTALPVGSYEFKAALYEMWNENYGAGGAPGGANIPFEVTADGSTVTFTFESAANLPGVTVEAPPPTGHTPNNDVEWFGVAHNSRDTLYRTPGGAVTAGTPVTLRLRTFHNDVTGVSLRLYDYAAGAQSIWPMALEAAGVSCYDDGLADDLCDFWGVTLPNDAPNVFWYRFIVTDGSDSDYYADNTAALDGGFGMMTDEVQDWSYALVVYDPTFDTPDWAEGAFIYQIFPDRFRNGNLANDPQTGDHRYDDPVLALPWGTLPEGYCRNYDDANEVTCPWRFDDTPPDWSPLKEGPRGRDYMGGDLQGIVDKMPYLQSLGVDAIYLNPIFMSQSNHGYDTSDFRKIDPNLGELKDFRNLLNVGRKYGIKVILDGVFNHMSSDSPIFDRYQYYPTVGACESALSAYRGWFTFYDDASGPCVPSSVGGPNTNYDGWFGFDSIPVINKSNPAVQHYFLTASNSITRYWTSFRMFGWRMDVMGDASFPDGYWESFRSVVKGTNRDAIIIGELWQKDSTLLSHLIGDRADTTMNYRLRDAVIGLLTPDNFDAKGFADSGRPILPSEFAERILSIQEDTPTPAYYTLMNLLDSHDTERLLWALTPGGENTADKELNAANLAIGKDMQKLAALIQFTMPGAPTVYYGDEVALTGDDDPDDRRTYPWADTGGSPDTAMLAYYDRLAGVQEILASLKSGGLKFLMVDDTADTLAYARPGGDMVAVVALNMSAAEQTLHIPVGEFLPDGRFMDGYFNTWGGSALWLEVVGGHVTFSLPARSGVVLVQHGDMTPPAAPTNLRVLDEGNAQVELAWDAVPGAAGYNIYRSPVSGGGWVQLNGAPFTDLTYLDTGLQNGMLYHYIVTAVDELGNESAPSNEVSARPHLVIGWSNLQWPPTMTHTISALDRTDTAYGQVWIDGVSQEAGPTPTLQAQLGFGPDGSLPMDNPDWVWTDAVFNVQAGNNDEFMASMLPQAVGEFDYAFRYSTTGGTTWVYADLDGSGNGYDPNQSGALTVLASGDTVPPGIPSGLAVTSASPAAIALAWDALLGDATLYGYEILRSESAGGPYALLALVTDPAYTDAAVTEGVTYYYVVRAVDTSFNRSGLSDEVWATAEPRTVTLVFNVTVPVPVEDAVGRSVYIAGSLNRLDGGWPEWDPGGVMLTMVDDTHWTITFTGFEGTQLEYKYTLGSWDYVEKDGACGEIANRMLTLAYGATGTQTVSDTVENWRNVDLCGNN